MPRHTSEVLDVRKIAKLTWGSSNFLMVFGVLLLRPPHLSTTTSSFHKSTIPNHKTEKHHGDLLQCNGTIQLLDYRLYEFVITRCNSIIIVPMLIITRNLCGPFATSNHPAHASDPRL